MYMIQTWKSAAPQRFRESQASRADPGAGATAAALRRWDVEEENMWKVCW